MNQKKDAFRRLKKSDLTITVLLVVGIIAVVNFFSYQIFYRWDLTENKTYSISDASKRTVKSLDDIVSVKVYFSGNLPNQLITLKQEVVDILNEYQNYSNGKVRVEVIDPNEHEGMDAELDKMGIPLLPVEVIQKDKRELINIYLGMAIKYGSNTEVIPVIQQDTRDLEYKITMSIKKATSDAMSVVGFLSSNGTPEVESELSTVKRILEELYTVREVSLADNPKVPSDIDTLIVIGPSENFSDEQLKELNNFLVRGGSLLVLVDGVLSQQGMAVENSNNVIEFLQKYGINLNKDMVADLRCGSAQYRKGFFTVSTPYPLWPRIDASGFNQDVSIVSGLDEVILPWASSVSIDEDKISKESFDYLAKSSKASWLESGNIQLNPETLGNKANDTQDNMMVFVKSGLKNPYSENEELIPGKMLLVGDSEFMRDSFLKMSPANMVFFQNLVDGLSLGDDLVGIRAKISNSRPIDSKMTSREKAFVRYINVFGVTVLVLVYGLSRYYFRKKSKFVDEL